MQGVFIATGFSGDQSHSMGGNGKQFWVLFSVSWQDSVPSFKLTQRILSVWGHDLPTKSLIHCPSGWLFISRVGMFCKAFLFLAIPIDSSKLQRWRKQHSEREAILFHSLLT